VLKKSLVYVGVVVVSFFISGCGTSVSEPDNSIKGGELVVDFPADLLRKSLIERGLIEADSNITVFGYKGYLIEYPTRDEHGNSVLASGLMVVPSSRGVSSEDRKRLEFMKSKGFSLVSDDHGTITANDNAPTLKASLDNTPNGSPIILTSLYGFVTLQPDYIGFGSSDAKYHPYLLAKSSANATLDFVKAAVEFAKKNNIPLNNQLYLTGYSEGGYVSMASLKSYEDGYSVGDMSIVASAPMAGPYIMSAMAKAVLSQDTISHPAFMADVAYAYSMAYNKPASDLVNYPYDSMLEKLFDGSMSIDEIDAALPHKVSGDNGLFTDEATQKVLAEDSNFWFNKALKENNVAYWAPKTPVRLIQCIGDDVIPFSMSTGTADIMSSIGANDVSVIAVEIAITGNQNTDLRLGHSDCATPAYAVTASLFASIRKQTIGY